jgi:C1A family cysteine protease
MKFINCLFIPCIIINLLSLVKSDLPVHCLKSQVQGKWKIYASELKQVQSGHDMKCGYSEPSKESNSWKSKVDFPLNITYELDLKQDDSATLYQNTSSSNNSNKNGNWTMIYNEGFHVDFPELIFFSFNKYTLEKNKTFTEMIHFKSMCYSTLIGWYRSRDNLKWGCYKAVKIGENEKTVHFVKDKNLTESNIHFVDPTYMNDTLQDLAHKRKKIPDNMLRKTPKEREKLQEEGEVLRFNEMRTLPIQPRQENKRFFSPEMREINKVLHNDYIKHKNHFEQLKLVEKSWKAELYPQFSHMSVKELNNFAGIQKIPNRHNMLNNFRFKNVENLFNINKMKNKIEENKYPENFDWKHLLKPTGSQGSCGSCYAWSTMKMLDARIQLLFKDNVTISVQHTLDCSFYNQGCKGGFSYLVSKFSQEFELVHESCHPYQMETGKCSDMVCSKEEAAKFKYTIGHFGYIGGSYAKGCNEEMMMEELHKNGPFVISIEPDYDFMFYKEGIFTSTESESWKVKGEAKPEWSKVDHSVLLVGWGVDEKTKVKYWLAQNSWGDNWGDEGFFKIKRGSDELNVESICEVATPVLKSQFKN